MVMKRLFPLFALVLVIGCNKPSGESCRKAIRNMRTLMGTDSPTNQTDIEGDVRRCKGGSSKKAVECAAKATNIDELRACDFMGSRKSTAPATPPAGGSAMTGSNSMTGSAPPPAGSGTATTGSAGAPTMTGSDSNPAAGSAAGSTTGSAAGSTTGSAAGSSTGSAAGSATGAAAGSSK
jgi:hypothetical protein